MDSVPMVPYLRGGWMLGFSRIADYAARHDTSSALVSIELVLIRSPVVLFA